jgi:hypothetical protein
LLHQMQYPQLQIWQYFDFQVAHFTSIILFLWMSNMNLLVQKLQ